MKRWLPMALCCLPGVVVATAVVIGIAAGGTAFGASFDGPLGLGLIVLASLACPLGMGLIIMREAKRHPDHGNPRLVVDCCMPDKAATGSEEGSAAVRLAALRAQRAALEREVAELQARHAQQR